MAVMREIEAAGGLPFTAIVNNANLAHETTPETVLAALPYMEKLSELSGLPVWMTSAEETVAAVKKGMGDLVTKGSLAGDFKDCIVSAGAKTGSAQVGDVVANGVFVCFAPFEEPEIAVAVVIEQGRSGAALASTAVQILNDYFAPGDIGYTVVPEGTLLP